jgi:hypothetical protein
VGSRGHGTRGSIQLGGYYDNGGCDDFPYPGYNDGYYYDTYYDPYAYMGPSNYNRGSSNSNRGPIWI